ncbi:hypothetical protein ACH5RR_001527 [Cinchona calisaya]|uniref:CCHC-type domain-containing protein n=1 Tax=Cinchona calisaya TaxID=153742 RepID=A0ABD3B4A2_9GENT
MKEIKTEEHLIDRAAIGIIYGVVEVYVLGYFNVHLVNPATCAMNDASNVTRDEEKFSRMGDVHIEHESSEGADDDTNLYIYDGHDIEVAEDSESMESEDLHSLSSSSDEETHERYKPKFNVFKDADMENPKFEVGLMFTSKKQFKDAVDYNFRQAKGGSTSVETAQLQILEAVVPQLHRQVTSQVPKIENRPITLVVTSLELASGTTTQEMSGVTIHLEHENVVNPENRPEKRMMKCSFCKEPGHNRQSCQTSQAKFFREFRANNPFLPQGAIKSRRIKQTNCTQTS